jgi:hypothetical protein
MKGHKSDIDDKKFFLAKDGSTDPKSELHATIDAFYNEKILDDNSTACRFPARLEWLKEKLDLKALPKVTCKKYDDILKRLDPRSVTLVFPAAHINSPASMFGHTFLRINSSYNSKLLSYAINYAAAADSTKENGVVFAIKGLTGGYYGKYSLLPYYDKLKEYRDTEARDIWEYNLNLTPQETLRMVRHIWELNDTASKYYFFTQNCSYNMLWLLEVARPSLHLREAFYYQVIPLETVHVIESKNVVISKNYRASKRSELLAYEKVLAPYSKERVLDLITKKATVEEIKSDANLTLQQKQYVYEATTELLEYQLIQGKIQKEEYLKRFHEVSSARASLGIGENITIDVPYNPDEGNRAIRTSISQGWRNGKSIQFVGIRPAYHDIKDSDVGFLRGTQIEFLDLELNYANNKVDLEKATLLSIESLAQKSSFFDSFSWRMKTGFDRDFMDDKSNYIFTVGVGESWGNDLGYIYTMADPFAYINNNTASGIGTSLGIVIDKSKYFNTNIEVTHRWYYNEKNQWLVNVNENYRVTQNISLQLSFEHRDRELKSEETYKASLHYFF